MLEYDFTIAQGADWVWSLSGFENMDSKEFLMEIRAERDRDSDLLLDVTPFLSKVGDTLRCDTPNSETEQLDFSKGFYDLFLVEGGKKFMLMSGCVSLTPQVTFED
jgi:hypothetical protein